MASLGKGITLRDLCAWLGPHFLWRSLRASLLVYDLRRGSLQSRKASSDKQEVAETIQVRSHGGRRVAIRREGGDCTLGSTTDGTREVESGARFSTTLHSR